MEDGQTSEVEKLELNTEEVTAAVVGFAAQTKQSRRYRDTRVLRPSDFRELCRWERELTSNYGAERKAKR